MSFFPQDADEMLRRSLPGFCTHARALLRVTVGCATVVVSVACDCWSWFGCVAVNLRASVGSCWCLFVSVGHGGFGALQAGNWRRGDYLVGVG